MARIYISPTILAALSAAILFGASTPFVKQIVGSIHPVLLAGLLYLGSGIGLLCFRLIKDVGWRSTGLIKSDWYWLGIAILFGGILGPILFMLGLLNTYATTASLLLNLEGVLTALLAWIFFKEHTTRLIIFGMLLIITGGVVLAWPNHHLSISNWLSSLAIVGACLSWAIDNNVTRKISTCDPLFLAGTKGFIAGVINTGFASLLGLHLPAWHQISYALLIGLIGYGVSLVMFVLALRGLGTARTGAYFSTAPFIGAAIAIILFNESTSISFWIAASLMGIGTWIHLAEIHDHEHIHEAQFHSHKHYHDEHHQHEHDFEWDGIEPHIHPHQHTRIKHSHHHYPDIHHRHKHK